jgi:hypothetical protein
MASTTSKSRSTILSPASDMRLRAISVRENRTLANVMENAVRVFTLMPKDLRDRLVEIASEDKTAAARFEELSRRVLFELARQQYERASTTLSTSGAVDEEMLADDEQVIVSSPVV